MLLPFSYCHIYRPLVGFCSVTPQNSRITSVISPHAKSHLNSASSVFYTKDAIISFVVPAPLQQADIIFSCISGNSNECISRRANAYRVRLLCQTMAGGWVTQKQVYMIAQAHAHLTDTCLLQLTETINTHTRIVRLQASRFRQAAGAFRQKSLSDLTPFDLNTFFPTSERIYNSVEWMRFD